jgi:hypothetical protein
MGISDGGLSPGAADLYLVLTGSRPPLVAPALLRNAGSTAGDLGGVAAQTSGTVEEVAAAAAGLGSEAGPG